MNFSIKRNNLINACVTILLLLLGCSKAKIIYPTVELLEVVRDTDGEMFMKIRLTNPSDRTIYLVGQEYSLFAVHSMTEDNRWIKTNCGADDIDFARLDWNVVPPGASCEQMLRVPTACLDSPWYMSISSFRHSELKDVPDGPILKSRIYIPTRDKKNGRYSFSRVSLWE